MVWRRPLVVRRWVRTMARGWVGRWAMAASVPRSMGEGWVTISAVVTAWVREGSGGGATARDVAGRGRDLGVGFRGAEVFVTLKRTACLTATRGRWDDVAGGLGVATLR